MAEVFAAALDNEVDSRIAAVASRSIDKATAFARRHGHARTYRGICGKNIHIILIHIMIIN